MRNLKVLIKKDVDTDVARVCVWQPPLQTGFPGQSKRGIHLTSEVLNIDVLTTLVFLHCGQRKKKKKDLFKEPFILGFLDNYAAQIASRGAYFPPLQWKTKLRSLSWDDLAPRHLLEGRSSLADIYGVSLACQAALGACWGTECIAEVWTAKGKEMAPKLINKEWVKKGSAWNGAGCERFRSGSRPGLWDMTASGKEWGPKFGSGLVLFAELALFCLCSQNVSGQRLALSAICNKMPKHRGISSRSRVSLNSQFLPFISSCHNWNITLRQQRFGGCVC